MRSFTPCAQRLDAARMPREPATIHTDAAVRCRCPMPLSNARRVTRRYPLPADIHTPAEPRCSKSQGVDFFRRALTRV
eukprot:740480-Prymnesium_polylepis.1